MVHIHVYAGKTPMYANESLKGEMKSPHITMNSFFKKKSQNFSVLLFILSQTDVLSPAQTLPSSV